MDQEPKFGLLPALIGGGAMVVCCLGTVFLVSGTTWLTGWFSGIDPLNAAALAAVVGIVVFFARRRRLKGVAKEAPDIQKSPPPREER